MANCPKPGVYENVPQAEYHSWPAVSSTLLKAFAANPFTCRTPYVPGDDANVGSGIHAYVFGGQEGLDADCIIGPAFGKGKKDLEEKAALEAANPTKTILPAFYGSPAPGLPIMGVLNRVYIELTTHIKIGPILANSKKELSLVWVDAGTGVLCKARLDIWEVEARVIWDLKKTRSLSSFRYQIKDLNYMIQGGFYFDGAVNCGLDPVAFGFIPLEANPPFPCECGYVAYPEGDPLDKIREQVFNAQRLLGLLKESQVNDYWPNFPPPAHIHSWAQLTPEDLVTLY